MNLFEEYARELNESTGRSIEVSKIDYLKFLAFYEATKKLEREALKKAEMQQKLYNQDSFEL